MNKMKNPSSESGMQIFGVQRVGKLQPKEKLKIFEQRREDTGKQTVEHVVRRKKPRNRLHLVSASNYKEGRWDSDEHQKFVKSCIIFGNNWRKVSTNYKSLGSERNKDKEFRANQISRAEICDSTLP